jgi:hypothetical protein
MRWHTPVIRSQGDVATATLLHKRLSATDISALASMKNVAKCDTWCELQNPVNHRVFERKLRPKPLGRGHACLGVTNRRPKPPRCVVEGWAEIGLPYAQACGWPKFESSVLALADQRWRKNLSKARRRRLCQCEELTDPVHVSAQDATPGQAGLPAELKHINKRRKRN